MRSRLRGHFIGMRISLVMAIASPSSPQDHEDKEPQEDCDYCWSGGMAHCVLFGMSCVGIQACLLGS
jgi:hypothetical protein